MQRRLMCAVAGLLLLQACGLAYAQDDMATPEALRIAHDAYERLAGEHG